MTDTEINAQIAQLLPDYYPLDHDFCHDLNAMWAAEGTLSVEQKVFDYQSHLQSVCLKDREGLTWGNAWYLQLHSTARQRAEAFLRTIGRWKE